MVLTSSLGDKPINIIGWVPITTRSGAEWRVLNETEVTRESSCSNQRNEKRRKKRERDG